jgi:GMP reductase
MQEIEGGLRSACAYVGADKLKDLSKCTTFVRVNRTHNAVFD